MNKLLIVLLAVCLVSTHAFVKRDATATPTASEIQAKIEEVKNQIEKAGNELQEQISKVVDSDAIKKTFDNFVDAAAQAINNLKPTETPKPAA